MLPTSTIREALRLRIEASRLVETTISRPLADLAPAFETLRDSPESLAVIVPGEITWDTEWAIEAENWPARTSSTTTFHILLATRDRGHGDTGAADAVDLLDRVAEHLLWSDLATPGLFCLPLSAEPLVLAEADERGREAWKLTVEIRQSAPYPIPT